jgi:hypothetical protein
LTARLATCARCRRPRRKVHKVMPDGPLCSACHADAVRRRGRCAGCNQERLLPGADDRGQLCCGCAGITQDYTCARCGTEWALRRGLCEWCHLGDTLDDLLAGDVDLSALRARLVAVARPDSIIIWLYGAHARGLLHALAGGAIPLTHTALDTYAPRPAAEHLRGLLVAVGLLPQREERLARFDRWVSEHLGQFASGENLKIVTQFASWCLRPHLVTRVEDGPLRDAQITNATQKLRVAAALLAWLNERGHDLTSCTQADLDGWFSTPPSTHTQANTFIRWAISTGRCPKLQMPERRRGTSPVLDHTARLDILRRLLDPATGRLEFRVAALLGVLFGQPFSRIAALSLDDVVIDGDAVGIRLGQNVTPMPTPFAAMLTELVARRPNLNTATNPTSAWLFPGRSAERHLTPDALRQRAMGMGINLMGARSGALRQLVLDCPPPVVADMLGYSYQAIDRHALKAGSPWASYAALRAHPDGSP